MAKKKPKSEKELAAERAARQKSAVKNEKKRVSEIEELMSAHREKHLPDHKDILKEHGRSKGK